MPFRFFEVFQRSRNGHSFRSENGTAELFVLNELGRRIYHSSFFDEIFDAPIPEKLQHEEALP